MNNTTNLPLSTDQSEKTGIVLNRMYTGRYLSTNLGHEVINMFQDDNGGHYLYLNAKGNYAKIHHDQISDMLLVRYAGVNKGKSEVQVIGWAKVLEQVEGAGDTYQGYEEDGSIFTKQREYITENKIKYGGENLIKLFEGSDQQNIYITYSAAEFYRPQIPVYIQYINEEELLNTEGNESGIQKETDTIILNLSGYQFGKATLKQYIYPTSNKNGQFKLDKRKKTHQEAVKNEGADKVVEIVMKKRESDWEVLRELLDKGFTTIDEKPLWEKDGEKSKTVYEEGLNFFKEHHKEISLFDIMPKLQRDENCFSDALKFFMNRDKKEWEDIFKKMCSDDNIGAILSIEREKDATISNKENSGEGTSDVINNDNVSSAQSGGGRIDLLIRTENAYIVIENKIKSDINSKESDLEAQNQLDRYRDYVCFRIIKDYINALQDPQVKCKLNELYNHITATNFSKKKKEIEDIIDSSVLDENFPIKAYFFVLAPDYNKLDQELLSSKGYKLLYYSTLTDFKKAKNGEDVMKMISSYHKAHQYENLWSAFYNAMLRHSYDCENDSLYEDMKNTFFARIQKCRKSRIDENA